MSIPPLAGPEPRCHRATGPKQPALRVVVKRYRKRIEAAAIGPGNVVAGTTLGVWVNLLSLGGHDSLGRAVNYEERLWRPALRFGFSLGTFTKSGRERRPRRDEVHSRAELL